MNTLKILLIHGIGHIEANLSWDAEWKKIIEGSIKALNPASTVKFQAVNYDDIFEKTAIDPVAVAAALAQLSTSGVFSWVGDIFKRQRGMADTLQWTLGMVAKWASDDELRADLRKVVLKSINEFDPTVICAHSLGSLIAYDSFAQTPNSVNDRYFMSFGSQIGNPFIRSIFGGRIVPLKAKYWYHLYNDEDAVATAPILLSADNFEQVDTYFDIPGIADHSSAEYLKHPNTTNLVWKSIVTQQPKTTARMLKALVAVPQQRALLIGINDYPNPSDRLEGCVNDVYLMSSVLQECGLPPENIRVVLNERATTNGIKERLEWLLEETKPGDYRFLFYSGHGAQIPDYGASNEIDHSKECLVPHDFAWSAETAIVDDWFCNLYSQLPYGVNFITLLDCCHSGGMTRNGSLTVRGLNPPDDIRHRSLRWDAKLSMWVPRDLKLADKEVAEPDDKQNYLGTSGASVRLGRAVPMWSKKEQFNKAKKTYGHFGPYIPVVLEACQEGEYSYEYRHGVTSFGAFTYVLAKIFRDARASGKPISWEDIKDEAAARLKLLQYQQSPVLVCPKDNRTNPVPFIVPA